MTEKYEQIKGHDEKKGDVMTAVLAQWIRWLLKRKESSTVDRVVEKETKSIEELLAEQETKLDEADAAWQAIQQAPHSSGELWDAASAYMGALAEYMQGEEVRTQERVSIFLGKDPGFPLFPRIPG